MSDRNPRLLTDLQAGDQLSMLPSRVVRLARKGVIPSVQLPDGEVRFLEADLWNWVKQHRCPALACSHGRKEATE